MLNKEEFSDVTFYVEGKPFYGHKIVISQLSEKFRAMFAEQKNGFLESKQNQIDIENISYPVFQQILSFLYSGQFELGDFIESQIKNAISLNSSEISGQNAHLNLAVEYLIDFLRVADEYLLEEVKNHCQNELIKLIDDYTFGTIQEMGELYNADRIVDYCSWYQRRKMVQFNMSCYESEGNTFRSRYSLSSTIPQASNKKN